MALKLTFSEDLGCVSTSFSHPILNCYVSVRQTEVGAAEAQRGNAQVNIGQVDLKNNSH